LEPELELAYDPRERRQKSAALAEAGPAPKSSKALWLALGVVALGLGDCARIVLGAELAPRESDWKAASDALRKGFHTGELIVAAPQWSDPMVRLHFGDLIPLDAATRADADRYATVWEVSTRGAKAPETAPPARCTTVHDGRVRVRRCDKPSARVRFDLGEQLFHDARAAVVRRGQEQPCEYAGGKLNCGGTSIGPIIGEIAYEPHHCVLAPPPALPGDVLRIEWNDVPLGRTLVGYAGIHSFYARKAAAGPVDVRLSVGGHEVARLVHHNADGWQRFEAPTSDYDGKRGTVRLEISSPQPLERKLCFALEARD
jgi:hypothetical protein